MSEHQEGCGCGCGHDHNHDHDQEDTIITLTLDDGAEMDCIVLCIFPAGGKEYIAMIPEEQAENAEEEGGEVYLYRYSETTEGEPNLENIEDDDEYEIVADAFDSLLDAAEEAEDAE